MRQPLSIRIPALSGGLERRPGRAQANQAADAMDVWSPDGELRRRPAWRTVAVVPGHRFPATALRVCRETPEGTYLAESRRFDWRETSADALVLGLEADPFDALELPELIYQRPLGGLRRLRVQHSTGFGWVTLPWWRDGTSGPEPVTGLRSPFRRAGMVSWHRAAWASTWQKRTLANVSAYWIRLSWLDPDNFETDLAGLASPERPGPAAVRLPPVRCLLRASIKRRARIVASYDALERRGPEAGSGLAQITDGQTERLPLVLDRGAGSLEWDEDGFGYAPSPPGRLLTKANREIVWAASAAAPPHLNPPGQWAGGILQGNGLGANAASTDLSVSAGAVGSISTEGLSVDRVEDLEGARVRITAKGVGGAPLGEENEITRVSADGQTLYFADQWSAAPDTDNRFVILRPPPQVELEHVTEPVDVYRTTASGAVLYGPLTTTLARSYLPDMDDLPFRAPVSDSTFAPPVLFEHINRPTREASLGLGPDILDPAGDLYGPLPALRPELRTPVLIGDLTQASPVTTGSILYPSSYSHRSTDRRVLVAREDTCLAVDEDMAQDSEELTCLYVYPMPGGPARQFVLAVWEDGAAEDEGDDTGMLFGLYLTPSGQVCVVLNGLTVKSAAWAVPFNRWVYLEVSITAAGVLQVRRNNNPTPVIDTTNLALALTNKAEGNRYLLNSAPSHASGFRGAMAFVGRAANRALFYTATTPFPATGGTIELSPRARRTGEQQFRIVHDLRWRRPGADRWSGAYSASRDALVLTSEAGEMLELSEGRLLRPYRSDRTSRAAQALVGLTDNQLLGLENFSEQARAVLGEAPKGARFLIGWRGRLVASGFRSAPWAVRMSMPPPLENVWIPSYESVVRDRELDPISGLATLGEALVAFTPTSIHAARTADPNGYVSFDTVSQGSGWSSHQAVVEISIAGSPALAGVSPQGVVVWAGAGEPQVALDDWTRVLARGINADRLSLACGAALRGDQRAFFAIPGNGSNTNNLILVWDYRDAAWWVWSAPFGVSSMAVEVDAAGHERLLVGTDDGHICTLAEQATDDGVEVMGYARSAWQGPGGAIALSGVASVITARALGGGEMQAALYADREARPRQVVPLPVDDGEARLDVAELDDATWAPGGDMTMRLGLPSGTVFNEVALELSGASRWAFRRAEVLARPLSRKGRR